MPLPLPLTVIGQEGGQIGGSDCETISDAFLSQPVNALSSLAFVLGAVVVLWRCWGPAADRRAEVLTYSALLALVGVGSVIYHGPQSPGAKLLHDWPIPVLLVVVVVTPILRWRRGLTALPGLSGRRVVALGVVWALAGLSYVGGRTGSELCDPDSLVQLHGAWHSLAAIGFVIIAEILYRPVPVPAPQELLNGTER